MIVLEFCSLPFMHVIHETNNVPNLINKHLNIIIILFLSHKIKPKYWSYIWNAQMPFNMHVKNKQNVTYNF